MARSRNIKPGFFKNEELALIEPLGRILFAGLWTIADREGRLEDRPKRIKAEILPYDDCNVDKLLQDLANHGFIHRYEANGMRYISVPNFNKHQNPHKNEAQSTIPAPDLHSTCIVQALEYSNINNTKQSECKVKKSSSNADVMGLSAVSGTSTVQAPDKHSTNPADSLNSDSFNLIPDSLVIDSLNPDSGTNTRVAPGGDPNNNPAAAETEALKILQDIPGYPFDKTKDLEHIRKIQADYPSIDILATVRSWSAYRQKNPLKPEKAKEARQFLYQWCQLTVPQETRAGP